jgi:hypothetical protein
LSTRSACVAAAALAIGFECLIYETKPVAPR